MANLTGRESLNQSIVGIASDPMSIPNSPYGGPGYTQQQAQAECRQAVKRRRVRVPLTDGGTAATAVAEEPVLFSAPTLLNGVTIISAWLLPQVAVTANNSNYATITIAKRTSGGAATTIISNTTQITDGQFGANLTAFKAQIMSPVASAAAAQLATATDVLTILMSKTGTGVAMSAATGATYVEIEYEET